MIQNKKEIENITTLESLDADFIEDMRYAARKNIDRDTRLNLSEDQSFFSTFRKFNSSEPTKPHFLKLYPKYKVYLSQEFDAQQERIETLENEIAYQNFFLSWERNHFDPTKNASMRSTDATRLRVDQIQSYTQEIKDIISKSPEAWQFYYSRQWVQDIESQTNQRLVAVPYVQKTKHKIIDSLNLGVPVYLVGHLGSGKTQIAIESAVDFTIQNKINEHLEVDLEAWFQANKNISEEDAKCEFKRLNHKWKSYYEHIYEVGSEEEIESLQPLFISGSHNLTYEDMFVEKTLSLEQNFSSDSFESYLNTMVDDYLNWLQHHEHEIIGLKPEEQLQLKVQIWKSFSDLLIAKNNSFGTTIQKIEREILIALRQGRPVIVDELNTIAMQNLIALNDLLQRHAGQTAYITGIGPVKIEKGFAFIGTGNLSTQMVQYEGTNQLNPAFQSRFVTIEYNYVPQDIVGDLNINVDETNNELYRVILSTIANREGAIQLPNGPESLKELYRFAQLSRLTQNVFMGKISEFEADGKSTVELREAVLSIRNIIHVLENWNCGEEKSLTMALWDGFISSITNADDQNYILSQAVRYGFFSEREGWSLRSKEVGEGITSYEEIRSNESAYVRGPLTTYCSYDIIGILYGQKPRHKSVPLKLRETIGDEATHIETLKLSDIQNMNQEIESLEYTSFLIDYLTETGDDN
ncbi:MAG: hypothetical protein RR565_07010 [Erysipelothrix sp.]